MAISYVTDQGWTEQTADATVGIPGSPVVGNRMILVATWKDFSVTIATPSGWTAIGTEFADGAVTAGNGTGSMKIMAWYRDYQTGDSAPTLDFSANPSVSAAVIHLLAKGSTELWGTPRTVTAAWPATSTTQTVSASSTVAVPSSSMVLAAIGLRDDSATFTRSATTGIDVASGITWNGNYTEQPTAHHSSTTGFDMAADAGYRLVTTGGTVTLRVTATISATETGAVKWVVQPLGFAGYAQAQAQIKALDVEGLGQAQAQIKQVYQGYGQAQIFIGYKSAISTFSGSDVSSGWEDSNNAGPWKIRAGTAANFSSGSGTAKQNQTAASQSMDQRLIQTRLLDTDVKVQVKTDKLAVGGTQNGFITLRYTLPDPPGSYPSDRLQVQWQQNASNEVTVSIQKVVNDVTSDIVSVTNVPRESAAADTWFWMRVQAEGVSPTTIRFKVWRDGTAEPSGWDAEGTASDASLQQPGGIGLRSFLGAGTSNTPVLFSFDNLNAAKYLDVEGFGQAQAKIGSTVATTNSYAQAQLLIYLPQRLRPIQDITTNTGIVGVIV